MSLEDAEQRYKEAILKRIRAEKRVAAAMKNLRATEDAYSVVCDSLRKQNFDFGENRAELELAIVEIESSLQSANLEAKDALGHLKVCEDTASECMLALRQAEIDHENLQKNSQRTNSKALENEGEARFRSVEAPREPMGAPETPPRARRAVHSGDVLRAQLADLGVVVGPGVPDALLERLHAAAIGTPHPLYAHARPTGDGDASSHTNVITGPRRAGAPPPSVRLLCVGQAASCLGPELSEGGPGARDLRGILAALGGTAPVQVRHGLLP